MKKKIGIVSLILSLCLVLSGCIFFEFDQNKFRVFSADCEYTQPVSVQAPTSVTELAETLIDSCVTVCIENKSTSKVTSFGSGVCIYAGGYIVTNYHVIKSYVSASSTYNVKVYLNKSHTGLSSKVLWYNEDLDVAIIQCSEASVPYVQMKDRSIACASSEKLRILEQVVAIGTPVDFSLQNWCTTGEVAKLDCYTTSDSNLYENLIGHTSSINHGNSGGALFDMNGYLVGLNTLGNDDANSLFFAIPIYPVIQVIEKVVTLNEQEVASKLKMPKIGLTIYDGIMGYYNDKNFSIDDKGVYIDEVALGGPCQGKLLAGDIVTKIQNGSNTFEIINKHSFVYALISSMPGDEITVTVQRASQTKTFTVTLIEA